MDVTNFHKNFQEFFLQLEFHYVRAPHVRSVLSGSLIAEGDQPVKRRDEWERQVEALVSICFISLLGE